MGTGRGEGATVSEEAFQERLTWFEPTAVPVSPVGIVGALISDDVDTTSASKAMSNVLEVESGAGLRHRRATSRSGSTSR